MNNNAQVIHNGYINSDKTTLDNELLRKSIHFFIGLVPTLAAWNLGITKIILVCGVLLYSYCEFSRLKGIDIVIISRLTKMASRSRDYGRFVLGPVTLGFGALFALFFYPSTAATIAIYALAFGDGFSSLIGKFFGTIHLPFTGGKTLEGSFACFSAVLASTYVVSGKILPSFIIALFAMFIEAIPAKDYDNLLIPVSVGLMARIILH